MCRCLNQTALEVYGLSATVGSACVIGIAEADPREAARRPTAFEAALPGGKRSVESGSGDCLDEGLQRRYRSHTLRTKPDEPTKNTNAADPKGSSGIALRLLRRVNVPRAPSLELYVLPNGGGQLLSRPSYTPTRQNWQV